MPRVPKVCERVVCRNGGDGESRIFESWRVDDGGGFAGLFARFSDLVREGGRREDGFWRGKLLLRP